jgi:hypothetical protein
VKIQKLILTILLVFLAGCGTESTTSTPTVDTTPPGDNTPAITVADISISASPAAINPLETSTITVVLLNSTGQPITSPKEVVFSLSAPALGTIIPSVMTSSGSTNQTFTAKSIEGIVTVTATADGKSASQDIQISKTIAASTLTATASPASITNGATSVVSASVLDGNGNPMPNGTTVNFSVDNPALGTIVSSATTTAGVAKATFSAGTTSTGTATVTATSGVATGTTTIAITGTTAGSIEFVSADPQIISIKGSGGQETSEIKFLVKDSSGNPIVTSSEVRLALSGPNGGEYLGDTPGTQSLTVGTVDGGVTTILHSGTIPGTATITATVLDGAGNPTSLTTSSGVIAIGGGTPSAGHFSLSVGQRNIPGLETDNVTDSVLTLLADRYGNYNVLTGTTVSFYSECGAIDRAVALDGIGQGTVTFRTQDPRPYNITPDPIGTPPGFGSCGVICDDENSFISEYKNLFGVDITADPSGHNPRDGVCSIIAVVDGEEEFTDQNANGIYDSGEPIVDTYDDIHLDMDDDPEDVVSPVAGKPFDPSFEDLIVDRNGNGNFDGMNGSWDSNKRISKRINLLITSDILYLVTNTSTISVPNGGSQTIWFALHDRNYNRPAGGSTLTVAFSGTGTMTGDTNIGFIDSNAPGTDFYSVTITDADATKNENKPATLKFSFTSNGVPQVITISGTTN